MQGFCERIIRAICPCLIRRGDHPLSYGQHLNYQKQSFIVAKDNNLIESEHIHHHESPKETRRSQQSEVSERSNLSNLETYRSNQSYNTSDPMLEFDHDDKISDYSDVMSEDHPFYQLFKQKLKLLPHLFDVADMASVEPDTSYPLKIYCKSSADGKTNNFKYFFTFPTDFQTYENVSNDFVLQKQFDSNIDEYSKLVESPENDTKVIYLSYKKILIVQPRDFIYVRYSFKKGKEFWSISVSDMSKEETNGKIRGEIILTATRIVQRQGKIEVSISSHVDMKMIIKAEMAKNRGFGQIRKYLDKVHEHILNLNK